ARLREQMFIADRFRDFLSQFAVSLDVGMYFIDPVAAIAAVPDLSRVEGIAGIDDMEVRERVMSVLEGKERFRKLIDQGVSDGNPKLLRNPSILQHRIQPRSYNPGEEEACRRIPGRRVIVGVDDDGDTRINAALLVTEVDNTSIVRLYLFEYVRKRLLVYEVVGLRPTFRRSSDDLA